MGILTSLYQTLYSGLSVLNMGKPLGVRVWILLTIRELRQISCFSVLKITELGNLEKSIELVYTKQHLGKKFWCGCEEVFPSVASSVAVTISANLTTYAVGMLSAQCTIDCIGSVAGKVTAAKLTPLTPHVMH